MVIMHLCYLSQIIHSKSMALHRICREKGTTCIKLQWKTLVMMPRLLGYYVKGNDAKMTLFASLPFIIYPILYNKGGGLRSVKSAVYLV